MSPCNCGCGHESNWTVKNLLAAFNGESNASVKYAVYSEKAQADGYEAVAALFAAASAAEKLHAAHHAKVIASLGGQAKAEIGTYEGKSIAEMLQDAIAGETEEFTEMYPGFIEQAKKEGNDAAIASFEGAMKAEIVHAKLYQEALENLDAWKEKIDFFVCPVCGWTEAKAAPERCPICGVPAAKFSKI